MPNSARASRFGPRRPVPRTRAPRRARTSKRDAREDALAAEPATRRATSPGSAGGCGRRSRRAPARPSPGRRLAALVSAVGRVEMWRPSRSTVDAVGDREHLVKAMADEQDRDAGAGELLDLREQSRDLVRRQGGRRLVHDQHADVLRHRLGDLDRLLLRRPSDCSPERAESRSTSSARGSPRASRCSRRQRTTRPRSRWPMKMFSATVRSGKINGSW